MRIKTMDSGGQPVIGSDGQPGFEFDDNRFAALDGFVRRLAPELGLSARDGEPIFHLVSQLAYQETEAFEKEYEPRQYEKLLGPCITNEAGEWAETVNYYVKDRTGRGQRVHPSGTNMPMAGVSLAQNATPVAPGGIGYEYDLQELRASAHLGRPLPADKQSAAIEGYKDHMNDVALVGETESNFLGLFKQTAVTAQTRISGAVWDSATADTMINDINEFVGNLYTNSKTASWPRVLALPPSRIALMLKPRGTTSDTNVLRWIKENNLATQMMGEPLEIVSGGSVLETAGGSSSKRMVAFTPRKDNCVLHIPMPIRFAAPQQFMLKVIVPGEYRYGGFDMRKAYSARYCDGL